MLSLEESLKILKETKALIEGHFILSSGLHSPKYVQCAQLMSKPSQAIKICESLASKIQMEFNDFDLILNDTDDPNFSQGFVRIKKVSTVDLMALVDDTEDYISSNYYDGEPIKPMLSGPAALLGAVSHSVIRGQIISLGIASLVLFVIMALVFRSLVGGVLASFISGSTRLSLIHI